MAAPAGAEETILLADLDLDLLVGKWVIHDYAGHYNRSDLLPLSIAPPPSPLFQPPWLCGDGSVQHDGVDGAACAMTYAGVGEGTEESE